MMGGGAIIVAIVDGRRATRDGLTRLIDGAPGFRCSGCFRSAQELLLVGAGEPPDILLVDLGLPGNSYIEGIRSLTKQFPGCTVLVTSTYSDDSRIPEAVLHGASGHLSKIAPPALLLARLRAAARGEARCSPETARRLLEILRDDPTVARPGPTELRLLEALAEGHVEETAADELDLPAEDVGRRVRRIFDKVHRWAAPVIERFAVS